MAITSNAQITLLHSITDITDDGCIPNFQNLIAYDYANWYIITDDDVYIIERRGNNNDTLILYDATTWQVVETLVAPANQTIIMIAKNVFTTDNSYAFVCYNREVIDNDYRYHSYIYNATGNMLADLGELNSRLQVLMLKFSFGYQLMIMGRTGSDFDSQGVIKIYSLPGQGNASNVYQIPQAAPRSRKFMRDQQVLIEHNDNIYTTEGRLIK